MKNKKIIKGKWYKINKKIKKRIKAKYHKIKDWVMDPKGYFLIAIDRKKKILKVGYCTFTKLGNEPINDMVLKVYLIGFLNVKIYLVLKVYRDMTKDYMDIWQKDIYLFGLINIPLRLNGLGRLWI